MGDNNIPNTMNTPPNIESELEMLRKRCAELEATLANERGLEPAPEGWLWDNCDGGSWVRARASEIFGEPGEVWRDPGTFSWSFSNGREYSRGRADTARAGMSAADAELKVSKAVS